jgi:hypothetical protein
MWEEFEDTKGVIRIHTSKKNKQHNGQKKKDIRTNKDLQNIYIEQQFEACMILFPKISIRERIYISVTLVSQSCFIVLWKKMYMLFSNKICLAKNLNSLSWSVWGYFFINVWRKSIFDVYIHWIWYCFDNYFTYFVPVFKYCYRDSRRFWTIMRAGCLAL